MLFILYVFCSSILRTRLALAIKVYRRRKPHCGRISRFTTRTRDYSVSGFLQGRPQRGHEQPDPETEADKPGQRFGDWQRGTDLRASTGLR